MSFLEWCREANIWLGPLTCLAICYRAVVGFHRHEIAYPPLFLEFSAAMFLVGVGSKVNSSRSYPVTWVAGCWTFLLILIVLTALFYNPYRKEPHA